MAFFHAPNHFRNPLYDVGDICHFGEIEGCLVTQRIDNFKLKTACGYSLWDSSHKCMSSVQLF